jgi:glycosyltransferase involved in cell wall biosynthesis
MTLVTPSVWLESLVKKSFLSAYPTTVIHNGVDTAVFKPTPGKVQERYCLPEKKIVLGAAAVWDRRKGLDDFIKLAGLLPQDYQIVLVGLSKDQMKAIPSSIVGIERTNSVKDLVELYSAANVFVNLTYEDNYPTTNLESIACRTPVVTYDTGGSGESAVRYGIVVPKGRLDEVVKAILSVERILVRQPDTAEIGLNGFIEKYMELYES